MMRFTLAEHRDRHFGTHFDLFLEQPTEMLRSWRLSRIPTRAAQSAEIILPHRPVYLDYSGPVHPDRGWVRPWDQGRYVLWHEDAHTLRVQLWGKKLSGRLEMEGDSTESGSSWLLRFEPWTGK